MAIGDKIAAFIESKQNPPAPVVPEHEPAKADEPSMAGVTLLLMDLIKEMRSGQQNPQMLQQAELLQQILVKTRPENTAAPMISVYSYPEGELKRPKPALICKMTQCGFEMKGSVLTVAEVEALNALRPGVFRVTKADNSKIEFHVRAVLDTAGRLEWLHLWYPCKGIDKHNHRSLLDYCTEAMGTPLPSIDELMAQLAELRAKLQAAA